MLDRCRTRMTATAGVGLLPLVGEDISVAANTVEGAWCATLSTPSAGAHCLQSLMKSWSSSVDPNEATGERLEWWGWSARGVAGRIPHDHSAS